MRARAEKYESPDDFCRKYGGGPGTGYDAPSVTQIKALQVRVGGWKLRWSCLLKLAGLLSRECRLPTCNALWLHACVEPHDQPAICTPFGRLLSSSMACWAPLMSGERAAKMLSLLPANACTPAAPLNQSILDPGPAPPCPAPRRRQRSSRCCCGA